MDPVTIATITSGVTALAVEFAKSTLSEAGKDAWNKVKSVLGLAKEPKLEELPATVVARLGERPQLAHDLLVILKAEGSGTARSLVGKVNAQNVVVAGTMSVSGDFQMTAGPAARVPALPTRQGAAIGTLSRDEIYDDVV